ncbi:MAG: DMT family transporter [Oscillospiraceae bacterium]
MKFKGILYTVLSAVLFGITPLLVSQTYEMGSNPETFTFYRNLLVLPVLAAIMLVRHISFYLSWRELVLFFVFGIVGFAVTVLTLYSSYQYVGVGTATTLHFLYPVFVALICRICLKERLGAAKITALVAATCGVAFFIDWAHGAALEGVLLAVVSGLAYAVYMVGLDKTRLRSVSPFKISFYMAAAAAGALLVYNIPTQKIVFALPPLTLLYTFTGALCTSLFAAVLLQLGVKYLSAVTAAIFCLFEPVTSVVSGWLVLGEELSLLKIIGSIVILASVAFLTLAKGKRLSSGTLPPVER